MVAFGRSTVKESFEFAASHYGAVARLYTLGAAFILDTFSASNSWGSLLSLLLVIGR